MLLYKYGIKKQTGAMSMWFLAAIIFFELVSIGTACEGDTSGLEIIVYAASFILVVQFFGWLLTL